MLRFIRFALLMAGFLAGCGTSTTGPDGSKHQTMTGVSETGYPGGQPKDAESPALSSSTEQKYSRAEAPEAAEPAANSVASSPASLSLTFSEALDVKFSGIKLINASKQDIALGEATLTNAGKTLVVKPAQPLPAGSYQVEWHALSVDGHKTNGTYSFSVGK